MQAPSPISGRNMVAMLLIPSFTLFFVSLNAGAFERDIYHCVGLLVSEESMVQVFEFVASSKLAAKSDGYTVPTTNL